MPYATHGRLRLYYESGGSGEPLLLITGLGGTCDAWHGQRPAFEAEYRVVAFDPRGSGRSSVPEGPYTTLEMAADACAVLDHAAIESAHVVGMGLGGMIAQRMALRTPACIRSLVLTSSFARADAHARRLFESWAELLPRVGWEALGRSIALWTLTPRFFEERPDELRRLEEGYRANTQPPDAYARQVQAILSHDTVRELRHIEAPTLVVMGEHDIEIPMRFARVLAEGIPGAELRVLPATGHRPHVESPELFNDAVLGFLRRHSRVPAGRGSVRGGRR